MRRQHCWKTCLFAVLALHQHVIDVESSPPSPTTPTPDESESETSKHERIHDDSNDRAIERQITDDEKQLEDSRQGKRNWKRWVRHLLLQEHIQNFVLLDGLLAHAWNRKGRQSRKIQASVLVYLENDDRRANTYALEPPRDASSESTMMAPLHYDEYGYDGTLFEGMILQVGYESQDGGCIETASTALYAIDTYQLLEPLHLELGFPSHHAIDFAYRPVEFSGASRRHNRDYVLPVALGDKRAQFASSTSQHPWWKWWFPLGNRQSFWKDPDVEYKMSGSAFAGGSHGEIWRGVKLCRNENNFGRYASHPFGHNCRESQSLIFKRLKVEHGYRLLEAGLREVYLGKLLAEDPAAAGLFTTYVNHFFREVPKMSTTSNPWTEGENDLELWIVFEDAGPSLRSYLYSPVSSGDFVVYQHSYFWTLLRQSAAATSCKTDESNDTSVSMLFGEETLNSSREKMINTTINGEAAMKEILRQILNSAKYLHENGIVHRDIKPSNLMCKTNLDLDSFKVKENGEGLKIHCRLGDFSSAWDSYTEQNLYTNGPSIEELTLEYAPPEALLGSPRNSFSKEKPQSYDSWSIGVLALELLLGTPNVFSVDQRTTALLTNKMQNQGASEKDIKRALYLAALSQFCIYLPSSNDGSKKRKLSWPLRQGDPLYKIAMVKGSCTLRDFHQALRARDPLGLGFTQSTDQLLHLIWQLLAWDPLERISAAEALKHPYFVTNSTTGLIPGDHNALESQMLDPRMDFNLSDNVDEFICPKCNRVFLDWKSCHRHANARRHAKFCTYDRSKLPSSVNAHLMLPAHPKSGYFDVQGRRPTIEDFHSIHLLPSVQFYGVFDGHTGNLASKYAASTLYEQLTNRLSNLDREIADGSVDWKDGVQQNITEAFADIHQQFLRAVTFAGYGAMDASGTTATAVYVTNEAVVVASLGDSRACLSKIDKQRSKTAGVMTAIQLTKDHVASDPDEAELVRSLGGNVTVVNGLARVNGVLAITRSIGDAPFADVLSRTPHIISMTRKEVRELCGAEKHSNGREEIPCFIILASDGLWDMVSNTEAVELVSQTIASYQNNATKDFGGAYQEASEVLTLEAYVRGSTDNIGVCVIALD